LRQRIGNCQKLHAKCGNILTGVKSFMQIAAKNWQLPKASCRLRQRIGNGQKLHANCGKEMAVVKSFMQIAAKNWQFLMPAARLRYRICDIPVHEEFQ
jgi:hypothetical protein